MGIWEDLRLVAAKFINRKASDNHYAVTKTVDAVKLNEAQRLDDDHFIDAGHRENISRILTNIGKFAVDETIKGVSGGVQIHKIAKDHSPSQHASDESKKRGLLLMMQEMPGKIEKMQDDIDGVKQQNMVTTQCDNGLEPLKELSDEPCEEVPAPPEAGRKRVFIRSRL